MKRAGILIAVILLLSTPARGGEADDPDLRARTFFGAGDYRQALELYVQLYAQTLHPTYIRNIGRCYQNLGEPDRAISSFREYLRKAKGLTPEARAEVDGFIQEMEELKRKRERPAAVPAATAPPPSSGALSLTAAPTEAGSTDGAARPLYARWWFWTALGAVVVAGVVTAVALSSSSPRPAPTASTDFGTQGASF